MKRSLRLRCERTRSAGSGKGSSADGVDALVLPQHSNLRVLAADREAVGEEGELGRCGRARGARVSERSKEGQGGNRAGAPKAMPTTMRAGMWSSLSLSPRARSWTEKACAREEGESARRPRLGTGCGATHDEDEGHGAHDARVDDVACEEKSVSVRPFSQHVDRLAQSEGACPGERRGRQRRTDRLELAAAARILLVVDALRLLVAPPQDQVGRRVEHLCARAGSASARAHGRREGATQGLTLSMAVPKMDRERDEMAA